MSVRGGVILRLDDVRELSPRLEQVWDVLESHGVPVHLEVIPAALEPNAAERLRQRARRSRCPVFVHQHGYRHVNHGLGKRRFEFGDDRSSEEQRADILAGRQILERQLGDLFEPIFTPPWDRLGASTLELLAEEHYLAVSVIRTSSSPEHAAVPRVPMTIDPVRWRPTPAHRPWEETRQQVLGQLALRGYVGIELHHEIMDNEAVMGLDQLLGGLDGAIWPTMRSVAEAASDGAKIG